MNFYKRFIGDIQSKTGHLSLMEFGAYDRLLDHCYSTERELPLDLDGCCRIARAMTRAERAAVASVLAQFFTATDTGYVQHRVLEMLAEAKPKIEANRANGKRGGRPKKQPGAPEKQTHEKPTGFSKETQNEPNRNLSQSQIEIHSVPNGTGATAPPPEPAELIFGYGVPMLVSAGTPEKQARSFLGALRKRAANDQAVVDALQRCATDRPLQPIEWLAAAVPAGGPRPSGRPSRHAGFSKLDYREGVTADGALA